MKYYKFSRKINKEISSTLKKRVSTFFKENELDRSGGSGMILKSIAAIGIYTVPFLFILLSGTSNIPLLFLLWGLMGIGKAFIGTSVMHDALHGSFSKKKAVNKTMGFSTFLIGANPKIWKIQHNVLHHTYTNIEHADEDIAPPNVLRFTPHQSRKWFHRFQHIYALLFYGISTLSWILVKDPVKLFDYRKKGLIKGGEVRKHLMIIIAQKLLYLGVFLGLPILVLSIPFWWVILMFVTMHLVTGILLTLVFQSAHVMPTSEFIEQEDEWIKENWSVHQLLTTSNFATKNRFITWFTGGLNHQIEHHLFPNISHIHYPKISGIVKKTAEEFNIPYYQKRTFAGAILDHFRMLRELGRNDTIRTA